MMRVLLWFVLTILAVVVLSSCNYALAQSVSDPGAVEVGESLIDPSSPLYFLKALRENIELRFTSTANERLQRELEFSVRRLREVKSLIKKNNSDLIPPTLEKYKSHLGRAFSISGKNEDMKVEIISSMARHLFVLQTFYDTTGSPRAKQAILSAIVYVAEKGNGLMDGLGKETSAVLAQKIGLRQISACNFLTRESTSSALSEVERTEISKRANLCQEAANKYFNSQ